MKEQVIAGLRVLHHLRYNGFRVDDTRDPKVGGGEKWALNLSLSDIWRSAPLGHHDMLEIPFTAVPPKQVAKVRPE